MHPGLPQDCFAQDGRGLPRMHLEFPEDCRRMHPGWHQDLLSMAKDGPRIPRTHTECPTDCPRMHTG
jgi:hypothetical protein